MAMRQLKQIDALYAQARALEGAAQVATVMAVRAGASTEELESALNKAVADAPGYTEQGRDPLEEARSHLDGRRCVCLEVTRLALRQGIDPKELLEQLTQAGKSAARLRMAFCLSDLSLGPEG